MNLVESFKFLIISCLASAFAYGSLYIASNHILQPEDPLQHIFLLKNETGAQCTAFATTDGVVFTAAHCIADNIILIDQYGKEYSAKPIIVDVEGDMAALYVEDLPEGGLEWDYDHPRPDNNSAAKVIGFLGAVSPVPVIQPVIVAFSSKFPRTEGWAYGIFTIGSPVWPGTSGGPLLNSDGKVIGIAIAAHTYHFGTKDMIRDIGQFGTIIDFE